MIVTAWYDGHDDLWEPLEEGVGPSGAYVAGLAPGGRRAPGGALPPARGDRRAVHARRAGLRGDGPRRAVACAAWDSSTSSAASPTRTRSSAAGAEPSGLEVRPVEDDAVVADLHLARHGSARRRRRRRADGPDVADQDALGGGRRPGQARRGAARALPRRADRHPAAVLRRRRPGADGPGLLRRRPAPAPLPAAAADPIAQIERLAELHRSGALTDAEFAAAKAKLLGS